MLPWLYVYNKDGNNYIVLEITVSKVRQQQLGVIFKQETTAVIVDTVTPQTVAARAGLKAGDVVLTVENKAITQVTQISKIIKSLPAANITLRIERMVNNYTYKLKDCDKTEDKTPTSNTNIEEDLLQSEQDSFVMVENVKTEDGSELSRKIKTVLINTEKPKTNDKVPKLISAGNENMSKFAQTIGNFSLRKRKTSMERASNDGSNKSTPTPSVPGTPQHTALKQHSITIPNLLTTKKHSISEVPEIIKTDSDNSETEILTPIEVCKGLETALASVINCNDDHMFVLKEGLKYLNVNVWGTTANLKDVLLGYVNIPLTEVLNECCNSMLGHYIRSYSFLPPNNILVTR